MLAVFALSFGDAIVKSLSVGFPLWQIYVVRSVIALGILVIVIRLQEPDLVLLPKSLFWTTVRSFLLGCMWVAYYASLTHIKLSVAAAVYYTIPLFITLFSAWFTGDRVTKKSWLAVTLGFVGVVIILRPDVEGFNGYALLPLFGAILYAVAMILTRTKCQDESPKVLSMSLNVMFILMGVVATLFITFYSPEESARTANPFLLGHWGKLDTTAWFAMTVLGTAVVIGSLFTAIAYQKGRASLVASFDYSYLPFSLIWGAVFFAEIPNALTLAGIVMIATAGLVAVRE